MNWEKMNLYWKYNGKGTWVPVSTLWVRGEDGKMYKTLVEEEE